MRESIDINLARSPEWRQKRGRIGCFYRLNISEMSSTSVSAAAIFSAEESCGRLPKRKDIVDGWGSLYGAKLYRWRKCNTLELHVRVLLNLRRFLF